MILVALLTVAASRSSTNVPANVQRLMFTGACALAGLAVIYHVATTILFANAVPEQTAAPDWMNRVRSLTRSGILPLAVFVALIAAVLRARHVATRALVAACAVGLLSLTAPAAFHEWTDRTYSDSTVRAFESWRARIPEGTEVLWFDSPLATWVLLERPSYLSNQQESSGLFFRAAAMAMKARVDRLTPFLSSEPRVGWRAEPAGGTPLPTVEPSLAELCSATDVKFVVTRKNLSAKPIAVTPDGVSALYKGLGLYACPPQDG
jgi:hypothetical protein